MQQAFLTLIFVLCISVFLNAQYTISGHVMDQSQNPLIGVNISTGQLNGTITDINGNYRIDIAEENIILQFSYLGYKTIVLELKTIRNDLHQNIVMYQDMLQMDEVVISANFNEKSKLESSISITTLDPQVVESLSPASALEALKQVPGIYVNDANGEIGVEIQGRGLGTPYFAIQEDGLNSSISEMASSEQFSRDMFLRNDLMIQRVEAVRGGSSGITNANSPGGIFNYISKTGGEQFEFEMRNRFGIQANGKEKYNRMELLISGPIEGTDWKYAVGGHYRYDGGNRPGIFSHSKGRQIKSNVSRVFGDRLSLKLYSKYLNDRVGLNRPTFVQNWNDIRPAEGFDWQDNVILPDVNFNIGDGFNSTAEQSRLKSISTRDQQKMNELTGGIKLNYSLSENWKIKSHSRISKKNITINHLAEEGGFSTVAIDGLFSRLFSNFNWIVPTSTQNEVYRNMILGQMEFYDVQSGETVASINNSPLLIGNSPEITLNNLPGNGDVFWGLVDNDELEITEIVQQLSLTGTLYQHQLTIGGYFHSAENQRVLNSATSFLTVEPIPRVLGTRVILKDFSDIANFVPELLPLVPYAGQRVDFANSTGLHGYNSQVNEYNNLTERVISFFANDEWRVNEFLNIDLGLRFESIKHIGESGITSESNIEERPGGADGNLLTVFDNAYNYFSGDYLPVNVNYTTFSFSLGANYKVGERSAIYARYSKSDKLLDAIYQQDMFVDNKPQTFIPRSIKQAELGYKYSTNRLGLFGLIYHSVEQNIFNQLFVVCLTCDDGFYLTDPIFNSVEYLGAELELNFRALRWWSIRSILNISGGKNRDFKIVNTGNSDGPGDDTVVDLSGEPVAGSTASRFDLSPIDITSRFYILKNRGELIVNYRRFAERFANSQQAFTLPSFGIFKFGFSYRLSHFLKTSFNINNVFNEIGILRFNGYNAVAGFPENVSAEFIQNNPETWFKVQRSLPRAYYFTVHYQL